MHIGVDLDNTVLDGTAAHLKYFNMASGLSLTPGDVNDFYLYRLYGWNKSEADVIYIKYGHEVHWNSTPLPMAVNVLQELYCQHQISIITSRPALFREVTQNWLKYHNIYYHNITFNGDKLQECINSKIDVLIDESPHYAEEFALEGKPIILFEQPYNISVAASKLVYRASNWIQVQRHIEDLKSRLG